VKEGENKSKGSSILGNAGKNKREGRGLGSPVRRGSLWMGSEGDSL